MKVTHLLIVLNLLIYAAMVGVAGTGELSHFSGPTLVQFGSLMPALVREGQWWRLITATFIHVTPLHLGMNMLALWQAGSVLEEHYGRPRYLILYLLAGLGGWAASLGWNWSAPHNAAGASGAITGLIGAGVVAGHLVGGPYGKQFRDGMLRWAALVLVFGLAVGGIDNAAHLGGLVAGAGVALLFDAGGRAGRRAASRGRGGGSGVGLESILLVALVGGSFALAARAKGDADDPGELVNRGVELSKQGKDLEAIAVYRRAIRLMPKEPIAHLDLSLSLLSTKDYAAARDEAEKAIALDPTMKNGYLALSLALAAEGRADEAKKAREKFLQLGGKASDFGDEPAPEGGK